MTLKVSYMGTKKVIAPKVAEVASLGKSGPLLDVFSGICAVGNEIAPNRSIWSNDIQYFSSTVALAFFKSNEGPLPYYESIDIAYPFYIQNKAKLETQFSKSLELEFNYFENDNLNYEYDFSSIYKNNCSQRKIKNQRLIREKNPFIEPFNLFTITYQGGFFSLKQCIELDSIRYAIYKLAKKNICSEDRCRWMLLALCEAASKVAATTGHFAQFLKLNENNCKTYLNYRKKSIWHEWIDALSGYSPIATKSWRKKNKVFRLNSVELIDRLSRNKNTPSIIYADPPYTADQYSRYYHIYETIILYDYPRVNGIGKYRDDRFVSDFSLKSKVEKAFNELIYRSRTLGCELILSYPQNGLLKNAKETILSLCRQCYNKVEITHEFKYTHSSLGASKGQQKYPVTELIFWAK